jgi:hypothetical protein
MSSRQSRNARVWTNRITSGKTKKPEYLTVSNFATIQDRVRPNRAW